MRQKKIKTRVIVGFLILLAIIAIIRINIEPSDYQAEIAGQVEKAVSVYQEAKEKQGNENGAYSWYTLGMFKSEIVAAKEMAESETVVYEDAKAFYRSFKTSISAFKKAANQDSVTAEELAAAESYTFETETTGGMALSLEMATKEAGQAEAVNFQAEGDSPWDARIEKLVEEAGCSYQVLSLLQNDAYPDRVTVTADWDAGSEDIQIYSYDYENKALGSLLRGEIKDGKTVFTVTEGGTYVLLDRAFDEEPLVRKSTASQTEKTDTEENLDQEIRVEDVTGTPGETDSGNTGETDSAENAAKESTAAGNGGASQGNAAEETQAAEGGDGSGGSAQSGDDDFWEDEELWNDSDLSNNDADAGRTSHVMLEVRCDTIVDTSKLTNQSVAPYVPADGVIFPKTEIAVTEGESVFEVLQRAMRNYGIQMEFREDPLYSGAYIEGINHIYEYDGGSGSGWMYKVNGWFPNYGCSRYYVTDGDEIVWCYTCDIGKDVGDQYWDTH